MPAILRTPQIFPTSHITSKARLPGLHFVAYSVGLASANLMQLATKAPVLCEIMRTDGQNGDSNSVRLMTHAKNRNAVYIRLPISD